MSDNPSPLDIRTPSTGRLTYIGGATVACAFAWLATVGTAPTHAAGEMPTELFLVLIAASVTLSMIAVILAVAYVGQRACAENQRTIIAAIGAIAAELEQHGAKLEKIDPWTIYTAVYEDLLKDRGN